MTATDTPEYRKLALDSSNDMIRYDSRWLLGEYAEAALHIRNAGLARLRMGDMKYDAGESTYAAEDWLSAAACFYLVPDLDRMRACVELVRQLDQEGMIPPERRDIHAALKEREEQIKALDGKLTLFRKSYGKMVGPTRAASQELLDWLIRQVRELPGSPHLHAEISNQAFQLGQKSIAVDSLDWALKFDPKSPHLTALRASQSFAFGDPVQAAQIAREVLRVHPDMDDVRFLLAQTLAFRAGPNATEWKAADYEAAIEELQPLLDKGSADSRLNLLALALATIIHCGLGHDADYLRLLAAFDTFAASHPSLANVATQIRQSTPQVFLQSSFNGPVRTQQLQRPFKLDHDALRRAFDQADSLAVAGT